jgi:hypothetical protein
MKQSSLRQLLIRKPVDLDCHQKSRNHQGLLDLSRQTGYPPAVLMIISRLAEGSAYCLNVQECRVDVLTSKRVEVPTKAIRRSLQATQTIEVCTGKACQAKGARQLLEQFRSLAKPIRPDQSGTMNNPTIKVRACGCLKRCGKAPVVRIDGKIVERFRFQIEDPEVP